MNIKKPDTTPFFVLFAKQKTRRGISGEICFGGNFKREKCERIIRNPFSKSSRIPLESLSSPVRKQHGKRMAICSILLMVG